MKIGEEVAGHLDQLTMEIELAIGLFPDELWQREGETDMLRVPAFLAHHTVWCMGLEHLLNIPIERMPHNIYPDYGPDKLLTKQQVLDILNDIRAYAAEVYAPMPNEEYLAKGDKPHVPLGSVMYTIAHTRHHLGQLCQLLKENGISPPKWYPIR